MFENLDPLMIGIALFIWPAAKSLVVMGAAVVSMWSRDDRRRETAERIVRAFSEPDEPK